MPDTQGPPQPPVMSEDELRMQVSVDFQDIVEETAAIQGQMVSQLTKDLAAQRAVSNAYQKKVAEMNQQIIELQQLVDKMDKELHPEKKPVENLEQAERVLDEIVAAGESARSNGDKPAAKKVPSPPRPTSPPEKEKVSP